MCFSGTLYLILQISSVDITRTLIAVSEISYLQNSSWIFGSFLCPLYFGSEVSLNTLSLYLLVLLNFHTISTWNIQRKMVEHNKNPLTQVTDNSTECLVIENEIQTNRTVYIDYRHKRFSLSIIIPSILIWFCCLSLSIPKFSLSTIVENYNNHTLCTMVDFHYGYLIRYLLIVFRNVIPVPLLILTFILNLIIVCTGSLNNIKTSSLQKYEELSKLVHLSLQLSLSFVFFSLQRSVFYFLHNIYPYRNSIEDNFKFAPLENCVLSQYMNLYSCMLDYLTILIRPILCIITVPLLVDKIKDMFSKKKDSK